MKRELARNLAIKKGDLVQVELHGYFTHNKHLNAVALVVNADYKTNYGILFDILLEDGTQTDCMIEEILQNLCVAR